jgi:hypothetical protein
MITLEYCGNKLPYPEEWEEIKTKFLKDLGPFKEELEDAGITFLFHFPLEDYELPVTFNFTDGRPTFDYIYRSNHYAKTGEYLPPL